MLTHPAAQEEENPLATVADPYTLPAVGWFAHVVEVVNAFEDSTFTWRAVHDQEWFSHSYRVAEVTSAPL
jgi:hypothetical protein